MTGRVRMAERRQGERLHIVKPARKGYVDYSLIFIVIFLLAFGLLMLYSTSSYEAGLQFGDSAFYFKRQLISTAVGLVFMTAAAIFPYRYLKKAAVLAYAIAAFSILMIIPFGVEANGAKRWLRVMGVSIQPAEVAKMAIIIFLAALVCRLGRKISSPRGIAVMLLSPLPLAGMIYFITDNLSSAIIVFGIAVVMLFVATPGYRQFMLFGLLLVLVAAIGIYAITNLGAGSGFRSQRIMAWLDPEAYASGKGFQTLQGLYAIGSGGLFGKGLGESMQKLGFIPEAQNDMIFSIICEELGLFGAIAIILMFVLLIWRLIVIANNASDMFGAMLVVGVMSHIMIQVVLNIAVVSGTLPNTGITLPFISYGGTSVLFILSEIGIVLNVARGIKA